MGSRTLSQWRSLALALAAFATGAAPAPADRGQHVDRELGYQVDYPDGWRAVPLLLGERWIVAKFASLEERRVEHVTDASGSTQFHAPRMHVIHLPPVQIAGVGGRYNGYVEWLDSAMARAEQGFHLVEQKEERVAGRPAVRMEHKLEKQKNRPEIPRRLVAWVFERAHHQFVVEFEVLEDAYAEMFPELQRIAETFTFLGEETPAAKTAGATPQPRRYDLRDMTDRLRWREMDAAKRAEYREQEANEEWRHARGVSASHWQTATKPHFFLLSEYALPSTETLVAQLEALSGWLDQVFGAVNDEKVGRYVFRYFASRGAYASFFVRSADAYSGEFATWLDPVAGDARHDVTFDQIMDHFLAAKVGRDGVLKTENLPVWMEEGLWAVAHGDTAGKKVVPRLDRDRVREGRKDDILLPAKDLMTMSRLDYTRKGQDKETAWKQQARLLFHFFVEEQGRSPIPKDFLAKYLRFWGQRLHEDLMADFEQVKTDQARRASGQRAPVEDDPVRLKKAREADTRERERLQGLIPDCCNWYDTEWKDVEKRFAKYAK